LIGCLRLFAFWVENIKIKNEYIEENAHREREREAHKTPSLRSFVNHLYIYRERERNKKIKKRFLIC
jgi:hypothetical protein